MSEDANVTAVRRVYEAFLRNDITAVLDGLTDDVEWIWYGPAELPFAGAHHGREAVAQWFATISDIVEFHEWEPREFVAQGDTVVVLGHERATAQPTGREFDVQWVQFLTMAGGKISRFRQFPDTAVVASAFAAT